MRNKNKFTALLLSLVLSFTVFTTVFAETPSATTKSRGTDDIREARVLEARRAAVKKLMGNQVNLGTRVIERLSEILVKIEARRDKMDAAGIDVSTIDALIASAKTKQEDAQDLLDKANQDMDDISTSDTPRLVALDFIKQSKELKKTLIDLHKTMLQIVQNMRSLEKAEKDSVQTESGEDNE